MSLSLLSDCHSKFHNIYQYFHFIFICKNCKKPNNILLSISFSVTKWNRIAAHLPLIHRRYLVIVNPLQNPEPGSRRLSPGARQLNPRHNQGSGNLHHSPGKGKCHRCQNIVKYIYDVSAQVCGAWIGTTLIYSP